MEKELKLNESLKYIIESYLKKKGIKVDSDTLSIQASIEEYRIRDNFFEKDETIYHEMDKQYFSDVDFPDEVIAQEMKDILTSNITEEYIKSIEVDPDNLEDITIIFSEEKIREKIKKVKEETGEELTREEAIEELTEEIFQKYNIDIDEIKTQARDSLIESLCYWSVYFQPPSYYEGCVEEALEVGLIPFYYENAFFIALGGAGMDLSPKLDAYQALIDGTLPSNSLFFRDRKYFEYIVGKEVTKKVEEKAKLDKPKIHINIAGEIEEIKEKENENN